MLTTATVLARSEERMAQYQDINRVAHECHRRSNLTWRNKELSLRYYSAYWDWSMLALRALRGEFQR